MDSRECPEESSLRDYLSGNVSANLRQQVAKHLKECPACQSTLEALSDTSIDDSTDARVSQKQPIRNSLGGELSGEATDTMMPRAADRAVRIGQYELLEPIGEGGMGTVYKARHVRLKRLVALKVLRADRIGDADMARRFHREIEAAGRLDHPNIVRATDADEADGTHYLVTEFVDGLNLAELVKCVGPLSIADACEIIRQAAVALQHADEHQLVHRDIKPSNLMLESSGMVKLLDLGLARFESEHTSMNELTQPGQIIGTVDYMAPEQADDTRTVDIRADIYSLGCTLHKLLSGRALYSGSDYSNAATKMVAHALQPIPRISEVRADAPAALEAVMQRMLAKDPADRYQQPQQLVNALSPFATDSNLASLIGKAMSGRSKEPARPISRPITALSLTTSRPAGQVLDADRHDDRLPSLIVQRPQAEMTVIDRQREMANGMREFREYSRRRRRVPRFVVVGLLASLLVVGYFNAATILRIVTGEGTLIVEIHDPSVAAAFSDGGLKIQDVARDRTFRITLNSTPLKPGTYRLSVAEDAGLAVDTDQFTLSRGGEVVVRITTPERLGELSGPPQGLDAIKLTEPVDWQPGSARDVIPGLLLRPARIPGIHRWQIDTQHPRGAVYCVDWSPDGRLIACTTFEDQLRIYNADSLRLVRIISLGTRAAGSAAQVAWSPDGQFLATLGGDRRLKLWRADGTFERDLGQGAYTLAWHPDGNRIAVSWYKEIRIYYVDSTPMQVLTDAAITYVNDVAWSPDGTQLASASNDMTVRIWQSDGAPGPELTGHEYPVSSVAWSPDGRTIASCGNTVRFWNADGSPGPVFDGIQGLHHECVAWKPDGSEVAVSTNGAILIVKPDGALQRELQSNDLSGPGHSVAWHPKGERLVSGWSLQNVEIWNEDGSSSGHAGGFGSEVYSMSRSPDGTQLATSFIKGKVRVWTTDGIPGIELEGDIQIYTGGVAWNPAGDVIASVDSSSTLRTWQADGSIGRRFDRGNENSDCEVAWSPDGSLLASTGAGATFIWTTDGNLVATCQVEAKDQILAIAWHRENGWIASAGMYGTVRLWKPDGSAGPVLEGHTAPVKALVWSPDGIRLASGAMDSTIRIWNASGETQAVLQARNYIHSVDWSDDGRWLVSGGRSREIRIWDPRDTNPRLTLPGHQGDITAVCWGADSRQIFSASTDNTIRRWRSGIGQQDWVALALPNEQSVTFNESGELLNLTPEAAQHLVYIVERVPGDFYYLSHARFHELITPITPADAP